MKNKTERLAYAVLTIVIGMLFVIFKNKIISIVTTLLGIALIVSAVNDIIKKRVVPFIIKGVSGIFVIVFGWLLMSAALYVFAVLLLIYGIILMYLTVKNNRGVELSDKILNYVNPVLCSLAGFFLLFNQNGAISWIFVFCGVLLVIEGIIALVQYCKGIY